MKVTVFPSEITGRLTAPSSKSQTIRAIVSATLAKGTSTLENPSRCEDALSALDAAKCFGVTHLFSGTKLLIYGGITTNPELVNCGESGLLARMMIPIASLSEKSVTITGEGTLLKRKLGKISQPLEKLGVTCLSANGCLPVTVQGPLTGGFTEADGSESSQFISGLLMACPLATQDTHLRVNDLKSKPYIDLTLEMLRKFNIHIENRFYRDFFIPARQSYQPAEITLEGDWSGAAFLAVAGLISGDITISGLNPASDQADQAIMNAINEAGADAEWAGEDCRVTRQPVKGFRFDATHCPDLFPPLAVLAAASEGLSVITGVNRLAHKESNRGLALQQEFGKLGIDIELDHDQMVVRGGKIGSGEIFSHHDHRIAMAAAIAGLMAEGPVSITQAECVSKSWPAFFDDLESLGAVIIKEE